ncbi:hypothetical protein Hanom_Chr00s000008g01615951 [Helianthus anomalus]
MVRKLKTSVSLYCDFFLRCRTLDHQSRKVQVNLHSSDCVSKHHHSCRHLRYRLLYFHDFFYK